MGTRQVLAEFRDQIQRRATLRLATGYVLFVGFMGLVAAWTGDGLETALDLPYLFAPLLACPVVAGWVLRARETGREEVLATTPITRGQTLLARTLAALLLTPLMVAATLPILYAASVAAAPGAFLDLLVYPAWAVSIGTAAATVGLLLGHLTPGRPRLGLALAFFTTFVWLVFGMGLGGTPNPPLGVAVVRRLSPLSHAVHASNIGPLASPVELLMVPLAYAAVALALLAPVSLGLQHASGWARPFTARPVPVAAAIAVLALAGAGVASWTAPEGEVMHLTSRLEQQTEDLWFEVNPRPLPPGETWRQGTPFPIQLTVIGPPNGTVTLEDLRLTSDRAAFHGPAGLPETMVLDDVGPDHRRAWNATGGPAGSNQSTFVLETAPREVFTYAEVDLVVVLAGQDHRFEVFIRALDWHVDEGSLWAGLVATGLPLLAATRWLPRRWNLW